MNLAVAETVVSFHFSLLVEAFSKSKMQSRLYELKLTFCYSFEARIPFSKRSFIKDFQFVFEKQRFKKSFTGFAKITLYNIIFAIKTIYNF